MRIPLVSITLITLLLSSCHSRQSSGGGDNAGPVKDATPVINYAVVTTYPHDTTSFTEGFLVHDGRMYESTGSPEELPQTKSLFGEVDLHTGKIGVKVELDKKKYFGEGIVFLRIKYTSLLIRQRLVLYMMPERSKNCMNLLFPVRKAGGLLQTVPALL